MKITLIKNIEFADDAFICRQKKGICVSSFQLEFKNDIELIETDHCDCIDSTIVQSGNQINITLVTEKQGIDEFIIFNLRNKTLKIRFVR